MTADRRGGNPSVVAAAYGCAANVVRAAVKNGELRSYAVGGSSVILFNEFEDYIRRQPAPRRKVKRAMQEDSTCPPSK